MNKSALIAIPVLIPWFLFFLISNHTSTAIMGIFILAIINAIIAAVLLLRGFVWTAALSTLSLYIPTYGAVEILVNPIHTGSSILGPGFAVIVAFFFWFPAGFVLGLVIDAILFFVRRKK